jgi:predicted nucleic acid-binding protein
MAQTAGEDFGRGDEAHMGGRTGRPVLERRIAFWDASALVPLCTQQNATSRAIELYESYEMTVWWGTAVEIASALARLVRTRRINPSEWAEARRLADRLAAAWSVVEPSDPLRALGIQVVNRYDLRAADALQLAAALEWCEGAPHGRTLISADSRLREAALLAGFDAKAI